MQALVWTSVNEMQWMEADVPVGGEPGWMIVESVLVGVCGSEVAAFLGHNELRTPPLVMGHEFSARVVDKAAVGDFRLGDLVTVNPLVSCGRCRACLAGTRQQCLVRKIIGIDYPGAFGAQVAVPIRQSYRITDPVQGALVEPLACAVRSVNQGRIALGDVVVVIGAGIIGLMSAWVANARGAGRIIVVDGNPSRLQAGLDWGATEVVNAKGDVAAQVRDLAPDGVDRVIDAVGFESTRALSLDLIRRGGRVVWIGLHENAARIPGNQIVRDETEVVGSFCYTDEEFRQAVMLANSGFLRRPGRWLDVRPVAQGHDAFVEQASGPASFAKILLQLGE